MPIFIKHILRNIKQHWVATLLMIVSLGLSASVVYLCLNISGDLVQISKKTMEDAYGGYDYLAFTSDADFVFDKNDFPETDISLVIEGSENSEISEISENYFGEHGTVLILKSSGDQDSFEKEFLEKYPYLSLEKIDERLDVQSQLSQMKYLLTIVVFITLALGFFVIRSVTIQLLDERRQVIATFRSIGATKKKTSFILVAENIIYGLLGGALGLALGQVFRIIIAYKYYRQTDVELTNRVLFILIELFYSVVIQLSITMSSLIRSTHMQIRDSLFRKPETQYEFSLKRSLIGLCIVCASIIVWLLNRKYNLLVNTVCLGLLIAGLVYLLPLIVKKVSDLFSSIALKFKKGTMFLSCRNLIASRTNVGSTLLCCMVVSLMIVVSCSVKSVNTYFRNYMKNYPFDIFVKGLNLDASEYDFQTEIPGIGNIVIEYWDYGLWTLNGTESKVCMVKQNGYSGVITVDKELEQNLEPGHVIIDSMIAGAYEIKVGDCVELCRSSDTSKFTAQVDGLCDSGFFNSQRRTIILSDEDFYTYVETSPALIGVDVYRKNTKSVIKEIESFIFEHTGEHVSISASSDYVGKEISNTNAVLSALGVLPFCAAIMAIVGMVNNQYISFKAKKREYGTFCSFGVSRKKLKRLLISEIVEIYVVGSVVGLLFGCIMIYMVRDIVYKIVAYMPVSINFVLIGAILLAGLAILVLASFLTMKKIDKMSLLEELKYE